MLPRLGRIYPVQRCPDSKIPPWRKDGTV